MTAILQAALGCLVVAVILGMIVVGYVAWIWSLMLQYLGVSESRKRATPLERLEKERGEEESLRQVMNYVNSHHGRTQCPK